MILLKFLPTTTLSLVRVYLVHWVKGFAPGQWNVCRGVAPLQKCFLARLAAHFLNCIFFKIWGVHRLNFRSHVNTVWRQMRLILGFWSLRLTFGVKILRNYGYGWALLLNGFKRFKICTRGVWGGDFGVFMSIFGSSFRGVERGSHRGIMVTTIADFGVAFSWYILRCVPKIVVRSGVEQRGRSDGVLIKSFLNNWRWNDHQIWCAAV